MELLNYINDTAKKFLSIDSNKPIAVYSHYDADGISSAAIIAKVLNALDKKFFLRILKNLDKEIINEIKKESNNYACIIFLDFGSNFLRELSNFNIPVFIIDHHRIEGEKKGNVEIINYRFFSDDYETSSSVLVYYFAISLKPQLKKELQKIALLGLIGDNLDRNLSKLSSLFLKEGKESEGFEVKRGLQVFSYARPLHKALEYSNIYIPGITGKSEEVLRFLKSLGIDYRSNGKYRTLNDLTQEEISKLITAIATLRVMDNRDIEIIGNVYLINLFNTLEDAREIATLLNACGRLDRAYVGVSLLLGRKKSKEFAEKLYIKYKFDILNALEFFEKELKKIKEENFAIINARDAINANVVGTVCSMLINSGLYKDNFIVAGLAYRDDAIKFSIRSKASNVTKILERVKKISGLDFEYGGHKNAAGAVIKFSQEEKFIEALEKVLREESLTIKI